MQTVKMESEADDGLTISMDSSIEVDDQPLKLEQHSQEDEYDTADDLEAEQPDSNDDLKINASPQEKRQLRDRSLLKAPKRYEANVAEISVPSTYEEAVTGPHAAQWTQAIREELAAHGENGTWSYVPRNPAKAPIKSKWVFKVIDNTQDSLPKFKAR
ncbi:hypothetical protein TKK_0018653 [Trichogramma kaykai]